MFTAVKRLAIPGQRLPFVQYIVSLAVAQAVQAEAAARLQVRRTWVRHGHVAMGWTVGMAWHGMALDGCTLHGYGILAWHGLGMPWQTCSAWMQFMARHGMPPLQPCAD